MATENKPIFLSVGYATCHWCHVMERESFESAETAALMNAHFVNIKVDREERPDVDRAYMVLMLPFTFTGTLAANITAALPQHCHQSFLQPLTHPTRFPFRRDADLCAGHDGRRRVAAQRLVDPGTGRLPGEHQLCRAFALAS